VLRPIGNLQIEKALLVDVTIVGPYTGAISESWVGLYDYTLGIGSLCNVPLRRLSNVAYRLREDGSQFFKRID